MTTRNRPNYGIYYLNLTNAGSLDVPAIGTRVAMLGAYNAATIVMAIGGAQELNGGTPTSAIVNVQVGKALGDVIPFSVGNAIRVDNKYDFIRFSWAAQAGVTAVMALSDDAEGNGIEFAAPPSVTLGNIAIQQGGNTAKVNAQGQLEIGIYDPSSGNQVSVSSNNLNVNLGLQLGGENDPSNGRVLSVYNASRVGSSFAAVNGPPVGATTILAAGSNTNGVTVKAGFTLVGGSSAFIALTTGTVAPTSLTSNEPVLAAFSSTSVLPEDMYLPPGQGLYVWDATAAAGAYFGSYTVH